MKWSWAAVGFFAFAGLPGCAVINHMDGMSQAQDLQKKGVPADARILRIWDTGMTVNMDPVVGFLLEVHPPDGAPYEARTKLIVSRLSIPQPGSNVRVRYDPAQPQRVSLDLSAPEEPEPPMAPAPLFTPVPPPADLKGLKQHLLETGVSGTVTILRCDPLGLFDADGSPAYDLLVRVELPDHRPIVGPARVAVTKEREHWFHVGQELPIKADPDMPSSFALDWERLESPPAN